MSNSMSIQDKLYRIGQTVDQLQQLNYQRAPLPDILSYVTELESQFLSITDSICDVDDKIVFFYTKANYLTVLIEIARLQGDNVHTTPPFSFYKTGDDFLYEYVILRMSLLRNSVMLYQSHPDSKISSMWMNQVQVNLANLYSEIGRNVEALGLIDPIKSVFGMARLNYAAKLYRISLLTLDEKVQKELLRAAQFYYDTAIQNYSERKDDDPIPEDVFEAIQTASKGIAEKLENEYKNVPTVCDIPEDFEIDTDLDFCDYKNWCVEQQLVLSIRNLFQNESLCDDLHLPNMRIGYFSHDNSLSYYSWFNTLKQEYNQARYFFYVTQCALHDYSGEVHESQKNILLVNTLDYPAIGYQTELLKCALKTAYGVLDKIGLLCNDFVRGKNMPARQITFFSWFEGIENEVRINDEFTPLYWVAKDLSKSGNFISMRNLRNFIEHRYLRVVDHSDIALEKELSNDDKMEYVISFSDLQKQTYEVLKLIRALLFYVVFAFNRCYLKTIQMCEEDHKSFIPLIIDFYDDEWKN